jgi:hypothetical protein
MSEAVCATLSIGKLVAGGAMRGKKEREILAAVSSTVIKTLPITSFVGCTCGAIV